MRADSTKDSDNFDLDDPTARPQFRPPTVFRHDPNRPNNCCGRGRNRVLPKASAVRAAS
jgi:hypothetical protein